MFVFKVTLAAITVMVVWSRLLMDFVWQDKRTTSHKRIRTLWICFAIVAPILSLAAIVYDQKQSNRKETLQESRRIEAEKKVDDYRIENENLILGALTPDISLMICSTPSYLIPTMPYTDTNHYCVIIQNTNRFPVYDFSVSLLHYGEFPSKGTKVQEEFNAKPESPETLPKLDSPRISFLPMEPGVTSIFFEFEVKSRRGHTSHRIGFVLASNRWMCARSVAEVVKGNFRPLLVEIPDDFPRLNGSPVIPGVAKPIMKMSTRPAR